MRTALLLLPAAAIVFLAAAGAGVFAWSVCVAAVFTSGGCLLHVVLRPGTAQRTDAGAPAATPLTVEWAFAAFLVFLALTLLPVPLGLTAITGQKRCTQNHTAYRALQDAAEAKLIEPPSDFFSATRNRAGTMRVVVLVIAAFSVARLTAAMSTAGRRRLLRFAAYGGVLVAVAGYLSQWRIPQGDTLWWLIPIPHYQPGPAACFINRNHYGGYIAMLSPVALALLADDIGARRLRWFPLSAAAVVILSVAVFLSMSRGALLALVPGLAAALALLLRRRLVLGASFVLLAVLLAVAAARLVDPAVLARLETLRHPFRTDSLQSRLTAWEQALTIWPSYPIAGAGANAFRTVYPQHRQSTERGYRTHVENEYVEVLADMGAVGAGLVVLLIAAAVRAAAVAARSDGADPTLAAAALGAATVAAVHALVDFPLHSPLYSVTLAAILGTCMGGPPGAARPARWVPALSFALACLLAVWAGGMGRLDGEGYLYRAGIAEAARAVAWAPTSQHAWWFFGWRAYETGSPAGKRVGERALTQAVVYDPNHYPLWMDLGNIRRDIGDLSGARAAYAEVKRLRAWMEVPEVPEGRP